MIKYDIQDQQHRLDVDKKKVDMEKGFMEVTKDKQNEYNQMNKEMEQNLKKMKDEKM